MKKNNLRALVLAVTVATFGLALPAHAEETTGETAKSALSEERRGSISQNCGTIRQSLKRLQYSDSRARTYFGAIYETVASKYITPLNVRLVKNDLSSSSLISLQSKIASARSDFSADFIDYSKSLEELISLDCRLEPDDFYAHLRTTREKRAKVAEDMTVLNDLLVSSVKTAEKLKGDLSE